MLLNGKRVDLNQLHAELTAAGVIVPALGTMGDNLHTYTAQGLVIDVPPGAQAVVNAHVPPPIPPSVDYGTDLPTNYRQTLAGAVTQLRAYLALESPTGPQTVGAVKLLVRVVLFLFRQGLY